MVNNCLFIINSFARKGKRSKKINSIIEKLKSNFSSFDIFYTNNNQGLNNYLTEQKFKYESIIVFGGDGTLHCVLNILYKLNYRPIIGYIPFGTLNDSFRNMGFKNINQSISSIKNNNFKYLDTFLINKHTIGFYCLSCGLFSSIPARVKSQKKKICGRFAYYFEAIKDLFKKRKVKILLNKKIEICVPFLFLLNGKYMAGFKMDKKSSLTDGNISLFYSKKNRLFKGLLNYFIFRKNLTIISDKHFSFKLVDCNNFNVDGEAFTANEIDVEVLKNAFKFYC